MISNVITMVVKIKYPSLGLISANTGLTPRLFHSWWQTGSSGTQI